MSKTKTVHPVTDMAVTSSQLRDHAQAAHRTAEHGAGQARQAIEALAALDMEKVFTQLRQMVALVSAHDEPAKLRSANVVSFPSRTARLGETTPVAHAAE